MSPQMLRERKKQASKHNVLLKLPQWTCQSDIPVGLPLKPAQALLKLLKSVFLSHLSDHFLLHPGVHGD